MQNEGYQSNYPQTPDRSTKPGSDPAQPSYPAYGGPGIQLIKASLNRLFIMLFTLFVFNILSTDTATSKYKHTTIIWSKISIWIL